MLDMQPCWEIHRCTTIEWVARTPIAERPQKLRSGNGLCICTCKPWCPEPESNRHGVAPGGF